MFLRSKFIIPQSQQTPELTHGRLWRNMGISIGSNPTLSDQVKRLEVSLEAPGDRAAQIQEALDQAKSDLAVSTNLEQQRQSIESEAEQQLQTEQDRLSRLEAKLDDAVKVMKNSTATLRPAPHS